MGSFRVEWKPLFGGGVLVVSVGAILVLGAFLEVPPASIVAPTPTSSRGSSDPTPLQSSVRRSGPASGLARLEPVPARAAEPVGLPSVPADSRSGPSGNRVVLDPLSRRTLEDPVRLSRGGFSHTLQIAVACRKENAEALLKRAGDSERLYVLPAAVGGQECFRFCWGSYHNREEAARAEADLPAAIRTSLGRPAPRRIDEVDR